MDKSILSLAVRRTQSGVRKCRLAPVRLVRSDRRVATNQLRLLPNTGSGQTPENATSTDRIRPYGYARTACPHPPPRVAALPMADAHQNPSGGMVSYVEPWT